MIDELPDFRAQEVHYEQLANDRAVKLAQAQARMADLVEEMLEAPETKRPALLKERADLVNVCGSLSAEYTEAIRRRDVSRIAPLQIAVLEAEREAQRLNDLEGNQRRTLVEAMTALRIMRNNGKGDDKALVDLEAQAARLQAEGRIFKREVNRAANALARARADLDELQSELDQEAKE